MRFDLRSKGQAQWTSVNFSIVAHLLLGLWVISLHISPSKWRLFFHPIRCVFLRICKANRQQLQSMSFMSLCLSEGGASSAESLFSTSQCVLLKHLSEATATSKKVKLVQDVKLSWFFCSHITQPGTLRYAMFFVISIFCVVKLI